MMIMKQNMIDGHKENTVMNYSNDIGQTIKFSSIAEEIVAWIAADWNRPYAQDREATYELRDIIIEEFAASQASALINLCPDLIDYLQATKYGKEDWASIALAVDNTNGMFHPMRINRLVAGGIRE